MKLTLFLVIGLIVNTIFAVLYPAQIFGDDPLGINAIKTDKKELKQYLTVNGSSSIIGYNNVTGQITQNNGIFSDLTGVVTATEGDSGLLIGEAFTFIDWVKVAFNLLKTMFMFVIGFVFILWQLVYPLNFLIGVPFSMLYLFALASFIVGRQT